MIIEELPIDALIPYALNNVSHSDEQINLIANSILQFGFTVPILVNKDNVIIAGHGRLLAAKKIERDTVPVIRKENLTPAEERAYRILDNKLVRDSEWMPENIKIELDILKEEGFAIDDWGLDDLIKELSIQDEPKEDGFTYDPLTEIKTNIEVGDLIELGKHRVICGDSTDGEVVDKVLNHSTPFIMVTDPPYGVEYDAGWRKTLSAQKGTTAIGAVTSDNNADWLDSYKYFPGDVAYVWHGGRFAAEVSRGLISNGFEIRNQIIWAKPSIVFGRGSYHWQHEPCWYAVRKGKKSNWCGDRKQSTLWQIKNAHASNAEKEEQTGHSTQKPIECMARPIRHHGGKGDGVYDPFLGSGTTLIAAEQEGRICYGIEREPKYCQTIINRYQKWCEENKKPFSCKINGVDYDTSFKEEDENRGRTDGSSGTYCQQG